MADRGWLMDESKEKGTPMGRRTRHAGWCAVGLMFVFSALAVANLSARAQPVKPPPDDQQDEPMADDDANPDTGIIRKLTPVEINRIRFMELRALRLTQSERPDRVTVKVPQDVVNEFLVEMQGHPDFESEAQRRDFRKLTPPQKLHIIAQRKPDPFVDRIAIQSDPEVFAEFRKQVMPAVLRGCAATGCHAPGMEETARFSLFKDPKKSASTTYANFILLSELSADGIPVINRAQPENSLLLTYLLPTKDVKSSMRHPGKDELRPLYQSKNALGYRRIERWIASLRQPPGDYGVRFLPTDRSAEPEEPDEKPPSTDPPVP